MSERSFTLIELLVVVAIVGFLASIIVVNNWGIRSQARDAQIQSLMHQVRNAAELDYDERGSYSQVCNESNNTLRDRDSLEVLEKAIEEQNGAQPVRCYESHDKKSFAASSPLVAKIGKHWCIESGGAAIELEHEIVLAACQ